MCNHRKARKTLSHFELSDKQFEVTQCNGTEQPFENEYWDFYEPGIYVDILNGDPLFASIHKYDSGTGWPSFYQSIQPENIIEVTDYSHGMIRTEVRAKNVSSHLGHIFEDSSQSTGIRYCINSAALRFIHADDLKEAGYEEYIHLFEEK